MNRNFLSRPNPPRYQFFIFVWPGQLNRGIDLERALLDQRQKVIVIASGVPAGPAHWVHLTNDAYFGAQFSKCLEIAECDVLVHIQADAGIASIRDFIKRMTIAFDRGDVGIWAPDVDYTFYKTEIVEAPKHILSESQTTLAKNLVPVLNTDCTCWALRSDVVARLFAFRRKNWNLGWGWDTLAAACAWTDGSLVLRDVGIIVTHPRGTGYNATQAEIEFGAVKKDLPPAVGSYVAITEALILSRYSRSRHWFFDRLRSRMRLLS